MFKPITSIGDSISADAWHQLSVHHQAWAISAGNCSMTYTHSLLYSVDPFTDTGILGTIKLNDH